MPVRDHRHLKMRTRTARSRGGCAFMRKLRTPAACAARSSADVEFHRSRSRAWVGCMDRWMDGRMSSSRARKRSSSYVRREFDLLAATRSRRRRFYVVDRASTGVGKDRNAEGRSPGARRMRVSLHPPIHPSMPPTHERCPKVRRCQISPRMQTDTLVRPAALKFLRGWSSIRPT